MIRRRSESGLKTRYVDEVGGYRVRQRVRRSDRGFGGQTEGVQVRQRVRRSARESRGQSHRGSEGQTEG